jgi:hypothetical protein
MLFLKYKGSAMQLPEMAASIFQNGGEYTSRNTTQASHDQPVRVSVLH